MSLIVASQVSGEPASALMQEFEQVEGVNSNPGMGNTELFADDDIVILVLGTDGSGKSMYINAMANYMAHYDKEYTELTKTGPQVLIPFHYVLIDETYNMYEPTLVNRNIDDSEQPAVRAPADACCTKTKVAMDYKVKIPGINRNLILIDTPGLSCTGDDLEGPDNVATIKKFLAERKIKHINYVAVLISSEEYYTRLLYNAMDAIFLSIVPAENMNIVKFIFTNGMVNDFELRDNFSAVRSYIDQENKKSKIFSGLKLTSEDVFVIDNVCIVDMAILKYSKDNFNNDTDKILHFKRGNECWSRSCKIMNEMVAKMVAEDHAPYMLPMESE